MEEAVSTARRTGVVIVALVSLAAGLALIWLLVDPRVIGRVTTAHMLIMLGLFLLPAATFGAWQYERSHRIEEEDPDSDPQPEAAAETTPAQPVAASEATTETDSLSTQPRVVTVVNRTPTTRTSRLDSAPPRRPVEAARHRRASDVGAGR